LSTPSSTGGISHTADRLTPYTTSDLRFPNTRTVVRPPVRAAFLFVHISFHTVETVERPEALPCHHFCWSPQVYPCLRRLESVESARHICTRCGKGRTLVSAFPGTNRSLYGADYGYVTSPDKRHKYEDKRSFSMQSTLRHSHGAPCDDRFGGDRRQPPKRRFPQLPHAVLLRFPQCPQIVGNRSAAVVQVTCGHWH
jgi:hypothetical protein